AVQRRQSATVGIWKNGFRAVFAHDGLKTPGDLVQRLFPGDALETVKPSGALRRRATQRVEHPVRGIHPLQVLSDLGAQKSARHRMRRVTLDPGRAPVFDRDQHTAGVRAVVRAGGMDYALHGCKGLWRDSTNTGWRQARMNRTREADRLIAGSFPQTCMTSFSFALLISSIFLISSSVSFCNSSM